MRVFLVNQSAALKNAQIYALHVPMEIIVNMNRNLASLIILLICMITGLVGTAIAQTSQQPKTQRILLEAKLSETGPVIRDGLEWRIFPFNVQNASNIEELAYASGGSKAFDIEPGEYIVHAAYGHAGVVKKISIGNEAVREEINLNAGGLKLLATATGNVRIPARMLKFNVYEQAIQDDGSRKLLARNIKAGEVTTLPVGTYHVVSTFGKLNATVRADLRVQPGKLTEANLEHRAAIITFRLVRSSGGDAVADTAWSILTDGGEVIKESNSTFPTMVLSEGNYTAIAKHNDIVYSQDFKVRSGFNKEVEVLTPN